MRKIAFLSCGHGYGHAARDLRIIKSIAARCPDVRIEIASQGTGVDYYRSRGVDCVDLEIPDDAIGTREAGRRVWRHLAASQPVDLVVTDEIVSALSCCRDVLGVDSVLLTDWFFSDTGHPELDHLFNPAREILVLDFPQAHRRPDAVVAPVTFTGPVLDAFPAGGLSVRPELGIGPDERVVVLTLGGMPWRREAAHMIARTLKAWGRGAGEGDHLVIMADLETPVDDDRWSARNVHWIGICATPERWYREADVVLVDAMGFTGCELARNGIPVIGLTDRRVSAAFPASFGRRVEYLESAGRLVTAETALGPDRLWALIAQGGERPGPAHGSAEPLRWATPEDVAARILRHLRPRGRAEATPERRHAA